ncbi:MAG: phosphotransferase [Gammaproteobacteria bacterium]|jgi:aminoglycoside phosphotransferase (APT) family kinase protein
MAVGHAKEFTAPQEVRDQHRFEVGRQQEYMQDDVEGFFGTLEVSKFKGSQSDPTHMLNAGSKRYIMCRKPPGELLKSAHAVDREHRVIIALGQTDVPVPRTYTLCEDESVIGTL